MATWLLQTNLISSAQVDPMRDALKRNVIPFEEIRVVPFSQHLATDLTGHVVPYGSNKLVRLSLGLGFTGLYFDETLFNVEAWSANRNDMLNAEPEVMTASQAAALKRTVFVRPVMDLKAFPGTVLQPASAQRWLSGLEDPDVPTAVSPVQNILAEYRAFVVDGRVVTVSQYRNHGLLVANRADEMLATAQGLADGWLPNRTCVMDIARTAQGHRVIEFNCINCSGFYANDLDALVVALTRHADGGP